MSIISKMKQEKGRTFNNITKAVKSAQSKREQKTIVTPIKKPPLTAKVNSTWNNVLNKNKDSTTFGKISSSNKFQINLTKNDPVKTLRFFIIELKNKIDILLPGNRAVKNIMDNIFKTFSKMEQPLKQPQKLQNDSPMKSQILKPQFPTNNTKNEGISKLRQKNEQSNSNLKENIGENFKSTTVETIESNSSKKFVEKLESSTLNESVNTERETIANYEQQCKRLQNEIKTLQDSASQKDHHDHYAINRKEKFDQMIAINKFKYKIQMAFTELEKEKLLTILKFDEIQINNSYSEFRNVYELIQNYFAIGS